jgi:hypothetical protein
MNKRNSRDLLGAHPGQNGKGDADRSPGWRGHYDEVSWPAPSAEEGFVQTGPKSFRKVYGNPHVPTRTLLSEDYRNKLDTTFSLAREIEKATTEKSNELLYAERN